MEAYRLIMVFYVFKNIKKQGTIYMSNNFDKISTIYTRI